MAESQIELVEIIADESFENVSKQQEPSSCESQILDRETETPLMARLQEYVDADIGESKSKLIEVGDDRLAES